MILRHASRCLSGLGRSHSRTFTSSSPAQHWSQYEMGPPDPIVGLNEAFAEDNSPLKINVGVGAYRSDDGLPYVLPCVREAEALIMKQNLNHEYLGIVSFFFLWIASSFTIIVFVHQCATIIFLSHPINKKRLEIWNTSIMHLNLHTGPIRTYFLKNELLVFKLYQEQVA